MKIQDIDFDIPFGMEHLWQYAGATKLNSILNSMQEFYNSNVSGFWNDWYRDVFNIDTANTFGLEVWGLILGVRRPYQNPENYHINKAGEFELYDSDSGLWHSIWLSDDPPKLNIALEGKELDSRTFVDDDTYRLFLRAQMFLFNSDGSIWDINEYLKFLFPGRHVFVTTNYKMTINLVFYYQPSARDMALIYSPGFLPLPAGVRIDDIIIANSDSVFGFEGSELATWGGWILDKRPDPETGEIPEGDEEPKPYHVDKGYGTFFK